MRERHLSLTQVIPYGVCVCILAGTYAVYDFFIQVAPSVMAHLLMQDFRVHAGSLGLLGALFYYAYAMMQMPAGWLIDRFGARKILTLFCLITAMASIGFSYSTQYYSALICRVLMGVGVSTGFIGTYYLAGRWLPHRYFSLAAAILHLAGSLGAIMAQGSLAYLVNHIGWRLALFYSGLVGLLLALSYILYIKDGEARTPTAQSSTTFISSLKKCLSSAQLRAIATCGFLGWVPLSTIGALWGVPYLMAVFHWDNVTASNACSLFWFGSAIGAVFLSWLSETLKRRKLPLLLCFIGEILGGLAIVFAPHLPSTIIYSSLFLLGICVSMQTLSFSLIKENIANQYFACASGMNNVGAMTSSALGQYLVGWFLAMQNPLSTNYQVIHYQKALLILPIAGVLGFFVCLLCIKETYCREGA